MFVTRDTMAQIKGKMLWVIFISLWNKRLLRDGDVRVLLDINSNLFRDVVDQMNKIKIMPP